MFCSLQGSFIGNKKEITAKARKDIHSGYLSIFCLFKIIKILVHDVLALHELPTTPRKIKSTDYYTASNISHPILRRKWRGCNHITLLFCHSIFTNGYIPYLKPENLTTYNMLDFLVIVWSIDTNCKRYDISIYFVPTSYKTTDCTVF